MAMTASLQVPSPFPFPLLSSKTSHLSSSPLPEPNPFSGSFYRLSFPTGSSLQNPPSEHVRQMGFEISPSVRSEASPGKREPVVPVQPKKKGVVPMNGIVVELLNKENYADWRAQVHTYLLAEELWDIVEAIDDPPSCKTEEDGYDQFKTWRKKNATALHAIQISCGPEAFSEIRDISSARIAWETLATRFKPQPVLRVRTIASMAHSSSSDSRDQVNISNQDDDFHLYEPLYNAVWNGDWKSTSKFITTNPNAIRTRITNSGRTALHIAVIAGHVHIVEKLVDEMSEQDLEMKDIAGFTALALAATYNANISIAQCMVNKNKTIVSIRVAERVPAALAFRCGHKGMGRYLYSVTPLEDLVLPQNGVDGATLICNAIYMKCFDIALDLLSQCPELAITLDRYGRPPLYALANLPSAFPGGSCSLRFWQQWVYDCIFINQDHTIKELCKKPQNLRSQTNAISSDHRALHCNAWSVLQRLALEYNILGFKYIYEMKLARVQTFELLHRMCEVTKNLDENQMEEFYVYGSLFRAVDQGNVEFIKVILKSNPEVMEVNDNSWRNIFMRAILHRQAKVFSLIHGLSSKLAMAAGVDKHGNNMLHMAAMLSPSPQLNRIPGAALQMQREIQWFKEVESIVPPWTLEHTNSKFMTPAQQFTKDHKELVIEGEKWMKETATSCTVVGALIVTIMFAAAFTVPGGTNQDTGSPMFLHKKMFVLFILSDAISLFSSTTSVLMFLGILTSRYAEADFLKSLPKKMIIGLSSLFLSLAAMMIAFCSALLVMLDQKSWIFIPIVSLAVIPLPLFVLMQFPLLVEIYFSTNIAGIFDRKVKNWLLE